MTRHIVLDLETAPLVDAGQYLDPVECDPKLLEPILPDSRLKDPMKVAMNLDDVARRVAERPLEIASSIAAKTAERNDKLGLDPDLCRIVALGFHVVSGGDPTCYLMSDAFEETEHLKAFWRLYGEQETKIVTFYGRQFDLPVLLRRSMYLGVKAPKLNLDRYRSPHVDVWDKLTFDGALRTAHSLKFYRKRLGLPIDDAIDGANVAALVKDGSKASWDLIERHCNADVETTETLAMRLGLLS